MTTEQVAIVGLLTAVFGGSLVKALDVLNKWLENRRSGDSEQAQTRDKLTLSDRQQIAEFIREQQNRLGLQDARILALESKVNALTDENVQLKVERAELKVRVRELEKEVAALHKGMGGVKPVAPDF